MGFLDIFKASQYKKEAEQLKQQLDSLCFNDYDSAQKEIERLNEEAKSKKQASGSKSSAKKSSGKKRRR